ncbi:MAG: superoxide dismutase [Muribaculaceae bacterium]|nr:superoxide dismutase [Muribaculaceae bacterium]
MEKTLPNAAGVFELMTLPYALQELEPVVSAATIGFHHGKHLLTYVNNLNALLPGSGHEGKALEDIVASAEPGGLLNNAGQLLNHNLYFAQFRAPVADNAPAGAIAEAIIGQFGSLDAFKKDFVQKGATLFGSGWVWLAADDAGRLTIVQEPNAGNPVRRGLRPLLTMDVWEHAYYLDYQNRRPDHLNALWQIVNWEEVDRRYRQ